MSRPSQSLQRNPTASEERPSRCSGRPKKNKLPVRGQSQAETAEHQSERRSASRASGQAHSAPAGGPERAAGTIPVAHRLHFFGFHPSHSPSGDGAGQCTPVRKRRSSTKAPFRRGVRMFVRLRPEVHGHDELAGSRLPRACTARLAPGLRAHSCAKRGLNTTSTLRGEVRASKRLRPHPRPRSPDGESLPSVRVPRATIPVHRTRGRSWIVRPVPRNPVRGPSEFVSHTFRGG